MHKEGQGDFGDRDGRITTIRWRLPRAGTGACIAAFMIATSARAGGPTAPAQPTDVTALHRSGQTFITWTENNTINDETYRVYRHDQPITAMNLDDAVLLLEVPEDTSRFYGNYYETNADDMMIDWQPRWTERLVIEDFGIPLAADTGLLVWTLAADDFGGGMSGDGYYAVTTVDFNGGMPVENITDLTVDNTTAAVAESVDDPLPVEIAATIDPGGHVYIQYMDLRLFNERATAPNVSNDWYGLNTAPNPFMDPVEPRSIALAINYAFDYVVFEPTIDKMMMPDDAGVIVTLHGLFQGEYPPTTTNPNPTWSAYQIIPTDQGDSWWFGFRDSGSPLNPSRGMIRNFTEYRVLRMIYDLQRDPPGIEVDALRVYAAGHSMGGTGAMSMAMRYPNVFAAANDSAGTSHWDTITGFAEGHVAVRWGSKANNLPIDIIAPNGFADHLQGYNGTGVYTWADQQDQMTSRIADEMAPFGYVHGSGDVATTYTTQAIPFIAPINDSKRAWGANIVDADHDDTASMFFFGGLPPTLGDDGMGRPFFGFNVVRDETVPGLSNFTANSMIPPPMPTMGPDTAQYNLAIEWSASWDAFDGPPIDTVDSWQMTLRTTDAMTHLVDVTPRRTQNFDVIATTEYYWENRSALDGSRIDFGFVMSDANGLVTVPMVEVSADGNRLHIQPRTANMEFTVEAGETIQSFIDIAVGGDVINVPPGTYDENLTFGGSEITVHSTGGPAVTTIDGGGVGSVVTFNAGETAATVLDGFTITNGSAMKSCGGGVHIANASNPTISNCNIIGNIAGSMSAGGGGVCVDASSPTFINCRISGNSATTGNGGGVLLTSGGNATFSQCLFTGNSALNGMTGNGGAVYAQSSNPNFNNCTITENMAVNGGALYADASNATFNNTIASNNSPNDVVEGMSSLTMFANSLVGIEPLFADIDGNDDTIGTIDDDASVGFDSPAVDAGDNQLVTMTLTMDLAGQPRITDGDYNGVSTVDIGVHELNLDTSASVVNLTQDALFDSIASAINAADAGDELVANALAATAEPSVDFVDQPITLRFLSPLTQPAGETITMADESTLAATGIDTLTFGGDLMIEFGDRVDIVADQVVVNTTGMMLASAASIFDVSAVNGISNAGQITLQGGDLGVAPGALINELDGSLTAFGNISANIINNGNANYPADTQVIGDYMNDGTTTIQSGVLTIIGNLTDNGMILGDVGSSGGGSIAGGSESGIAVFGDFVAGSDAMLVMSSPQLSVRVEGNFDVAINDNMNFDLSEAELRTVGLSGAMQNLEVMSADIGANLFGLNREIAGHYPIGTLRIGPAPRTTTLVDNHDNANDGDRVCEAIYVDELIVDNGATLNTNACRIYYNTLTLNGTVDNPANLIELPEPQAGDLNGDGCVNQSDLGILLAAFNLNGGGDLDGDLDTDQSDLGILLANFGSGCRG